MAARRRLRRGWWPGAGSAPSTYEKSRWFQPQLRHTSTAYTENSCCMASIRASSALFFACPVCRRERLTMVSYVYGDALGPVAGQAKTEAELARMDAMQEEFSVYAVEVCRGCGWNHLTCSYVLGAEPEPGRQPRRSRRKAARE